MSLLWGEGLCHCCGGRGYVADVGGGVRWLMWGEGLGG